MIKLTHGIKYLKACVCVGVCMGFFCLFFLFLVQVNIPFAVFIAVHSSFSDVYI